MIIEKEKMDIYIFIYIKYLLIPQAELLRRTKLLQLQNQREYNYRYHQREYMITIFLLYYFLRRNEIIDLYGTEIPRPI